MVYHRNPRMHVLGNHGPGGMLHALLAPLATSIISQSAYSGWEPRAWLTQGLEQHSGRIVDLGCGVGTSTAHVGIDASSAMIRMARIYRPDATFAQGDAETWGDDDECGATTLSFVLHEAPRDARRRILRNAVRISTDVVCVMDICPTYTPSDAMLWGEPYILEYQRRIDADVLRVAKATGRTSARHSIVPGHIVLWILAADEDTLRGTEESLSLSSLTQRAPHSRG
jgi:SAM-dependent methyltransferase